MKEEIKITPGLLEELEEKAEEATPGPWRECCAPRDNMIEGPECELVIGLDERYRCPLIVNESLHDDIAKIIAEHCEPRVGISEEDLSYITAANPTVILALIEKIKEDAATIGDLNEELELCNFISDKFYRFLNELLATLKIEPDILNYARKIGDVYAEILRKVEELKHK